ncbi:MAG: chemotaxis protein CheB [Chloroflexia bacterium]
MIHESERAVAGHDIIVVGASAGGVEALMKLAGNLPRDLPASVFMVLHIPPEAPSVLPGILGRSGILPVAHPEDGDKIKQGRIYVAPPDFHMLLEDGRVRLARGPRENRHRPAVDPLFRSAAVAYGPRVVGVVLTGALDDGAVGLRSVKVRGGKAVVQDPEDALYPGMPSSAIRTTQVDHILPLKAIPPMLVRLVHQEAEDESRYPLHGELEIEAKMADMQTNNLENLQQLGAVPSVFSCPECHGTLWEMRSGDFLRFRCQVGHAYSAESMLADQSDAVERALWASLRALEERSELMRRLAVRSANHNSHHAATRFTRAAQETEQHVAVVKGILESNGYHPEDQAELEDVGS